MNTRVREGGDDFERAILTCGVQQWAERFASTHSAAIDYIEQAPVIVLAASAGIHASARGNEIVCRQFGSLCERGPRLGEIMRYT